MTKAEPSRIADLVKRLHSPSGIGEPLDHAAMSEAATIITALSAKLKEQKAAHAKMAREIADQLDFACNHVTWSPIRLRRLADKIEGGE